LNINVDDARKKILEREQHYIDTLKPEYNLLPTAGSWLGFNHSEQTKAKLHLAMLGKMSGEKNPMFGRTGESHPNFGKTHPTETLILISEALSGENHPLFGKSCSASTKQKISEAMSGEKNHFFGLTHSAETKAKLSLAMSGENNHMYGRTGVNNPNFGKSPSAETVAKQSIVKGGGIIFVYNTQGSLVNSFSSARKAAEFFHTSHSTIVRYVKNNKLYKNQWILSIIENTPASSKNISDNG